MFRLAMCNDFVELRKKNPQHANPEELGWTLKELGRLFVVEQIMQRKPARILEVGGGLCPFFYERFAHSLEYWMADNGDLYPNPDEFREKMGMWEKVNYVDALLGDFCPQLPDNYFDLVFSISALEHTPRNPPQLVEDVCKDMYRVLKPGGYTCHTIDVAPSNTTTGKFRDAFKDSGLVYCEEPEELCWDVSSKSNQILLESINTVWRKYYKKYHQTNRPVTWFHFGSILVLAQKPIEEKENIEDKENIEEKENEEKK